MKRDELLFGTGALVGLIINAILSWWHPPWWVALITFPIGIWYAVRLTLAWRTELRQSNRQHWKDI